MFVLMLLKMTYLSSDFNKLFFVDGHVFIRILFSNPSLLFRMSTINWKWLIDKGAGKYYVINFCPILNPHLPLRNQDIHVPDPPQIPKKIAIHARVLNFLMYFSSVFSKILTAVLFARKFYCLIYCLLVHGKVCLFKCFIAGMFAREFSSFMYFL